MAEKIKIYSILICFIFFIISIIISYFALKKFYDLEKWIGIFDKELQILKGSLVRMDSYPPFKETKKTEKKTRISRHSDQAEIERINNKLNNPY